MKGSGMRGWNASSSSPGVWRAIAGFIVWASAFVVLYAGHALGCVYVPSSIQPATVTAALVVLWAVHMAAGAALAWRSGGRLRLLRHDGDCRVRARFMWRAAFLIDASALGATFVTGLPLLAFPACHP
ncbi:hypothetical protein CSC67_18300 [Pusillimonas caeni]|uniref:hypothetical protein n=1 Tax=Pusillimonas caeni TaxID=1348472 RepID=UPI000E59DFB4|nr:hypothetical protein [Pusillimonas caeni]TFL10005.1 hypothetical protein CSC67_18300 [Pusillimonas caeni]